MGYRRTDDELRQELAEQVEALRASAESYDRGNKWEAKRLAATAYILVHDGHGRAKSLLGQLGLKSKISFYSTTSDPSGQRNPNLPLCTISLGELKRDRWGGAAEYTPLFTGDSCNKIPLSFTKWYEECIFTNENGVHLTRKNVIFSLRSQVGGAHVDRKITDDNFVYLAAGPQSVTVRFQSAADKAAGVPPTDLGTSIVANAHLATMRQIAWELDESLKESGL